MSFDALSRNNLHCLEETVGRNIDLKGLRWNEKHFIGK